MDNYDKDSRAGEMRGASFKRIIGLGRVFQNFHSFPRERTELFARCRGYQTLRASNNDQGAEKNTQFHRPNEN